MSGLVDPALDAWLFVCSLAFLAGMLLVLSSAWPGVRARYPKGLLHGFLLAIASFAAVGLGAWLLG